MFNVFVKATGFVLVVILGFILKRIKVLEKKDGNTLATIIMNITLPCALLSNANGMIVNAAMIGLILIGIFSNVFIVIVGYFLDQDALKKGMFMINCSGYNIGNFVLPFVETFFPGMGVAYLCMFDIGNALMGLGGTYAIAGSVANSQDKLTFKSVCKKLFSSIPFDVYIILFILALFQIKVPAPVLSISTFIGSGNGFLAMLMIGLMLEIKVSASEIKDVLKILITRIGFNSLFMLACYFLLPFPLLARKILVLALAAPLSTVSAVFSKKIGYYRDAPAIANSMSIIISIVELTVLIMLFV